MNATTDLMSRGDLVLAVAMDFQRVGLAVGFDGTIKPVLDPDTLWRVPNDT